MSSRIIAAAAAVAIGLLPTAPARAQENPTSQEMQELRSLLEALRMDQLLRQREIDELESRLDSVESGMTGLSDPRILGPEEEAALRGRGLTGPQPVEEIPVAQPHSPNRASLEAEENPFSGAIRELGTEEQANTRGRGQAPANGVQLVAAENGGEGPPSVEEEEVQREPTTALSVEAVTQDQQGQFGERLSFALGMSYSHFDQARLNLSGFLALDAIFLGRISLDQTTSDVFSFDATANYGLTDRLQVQLTVPFLYRTSNYQSGGAGGSAAGQAEADVSASGLGDISAGVSFRLLTETLNRPDTVISLRGKAPTGEHPYGVPLVEILGSEGNLNVPTKLPTGSGNWGSSIGVSLLKTIDPLIVFGNVSYFYNFPQAFDDINESVGNQPGTVEQGHAFQYGGGVAFAVNERSSLSFSFTQRLATRTALRFQGGVSQDIVGSNANVASLNIGGTFAFSENVSMVVNVGAGLTADTPDFSLTTRLPFRF